MGLLHLVRHFRMLTIGLLYLVMATSPNLAAADSPSLTNGSMAQAIDYLSLLSGQDLSTDDVEWLKQRWKEEFEATPEATAAEIDVLAIAFERHQREEDPLALAQMRTTILTDIYCSSAKASDPESRRLQEILTPEGGILAADCLLGLVVTRFDVDGLVASHALLADVVGTSHDAESDRAAILTAIETGFDDLALANKGGLANGELRHAVLARYWSRIDGSDRKKAFIEEARQVDVADLSGPARQFEDVALKQLGEVDYLVKIGTASLTTSDVGAYEEWLQRIAGQALASRDRDWLQQAIIDDFRADPEKALGEVAGIREMNRDHILAKTPDEKRRLVENWAAGLYCYASASSDPAERHLVEVVFRDDPVVDADCATAAITRKSHQVIADADGAQLLEQDLDVSLGFLEMLLARPLLSEEEAIVREDNIQTFQRDPVDWRNQNEKYRALLAEVDKHDTSVFLGVRKRKDLFDPIYCALSASDEPYAADYLAMFRRNAAIVHEDCDESLVNTRDEVDAFVAFSNFLAMLNGRQPFDEAQTEGIRQSAASIDLDEVEVTMAALEEWWSLMNLGEKAVEAQKVQAKGITPESDGSEISTFVNFAKLAVVNTNALIRNCAVMRTINEGNVALFAARSGGFLMSSQGDELGFSSSDLENIVFSTSLAAGLCG